MVGKNNFYSTKIFILLNLFSQFFSGVIEIKNYTFPPYVCNNDYECGQTFYVDMSAYKDFHLNFTVEVLTPGYHIDLNRLYYEYSDNLKEKLTDRRTSRGFSLYNDKEKQMAAYYILDNIFIRKKYIIFNRSPVGTYFPLSIYYYVNIYEDSYYKKSNHSGSNIFLNILYIFIGLIVLSLIIICLEKICCSRKYSSNSSSSTYLILKIN